MSELAVLDASALANFVVEPGRHPRLRELLSAEEATLVVPHLCDIEVVSALRSLLARGVMAPSRAAEVLQDYADLPLERIDHLPLLDRVLALRENFSAYDAVYVALAEATGAVLRTADERLARAVRAHTAVVVEEV